MLARILLIDAMCKPIVLPSLTITYSEISSHILLPGTWSCSKPFFSLTNRNNFPDI